MTNKACINIQNYEIVWNKQKNLSYIFFLT